MGAAIPEAQLGPSPFVVETSKCDTGPCELGRELINGGQTSWAKLLKPRKLPPPKLRNPPPPKPRNPPPPRKPPPPKPLANASGGSRETISTADATNTAIRRMAWPRQKVWSLGLLS